MKENAAVSNLLLRAMTVELADSKAVKQAYVYFNEYLGRPPLLPYQIRAYAADLADYPTDAVVDALHAMRREPGRRFVPLPWEVIAYLRPEQNTECAASEMAADIVSCVVKCGRPHADLAEKKLGKIGWDVVNRLGGWSQICQTLRSDEVNTFRAQARGVAKAALERKSYEKRRQLLDGKAVAPALDNKRDTLLATQNQKWLRETVSQLAQQKAQGVL